MQDKIGEKKHFRQIIAPTVGRIVHYYWVQGADPKREVLGPRAAIIACVHPVAPNGITNLTLTVFISDGTPQSAHFVPLRQPGEEPVGYQWAEWPKHQ